MFEKIKGWLAAIIGGLAVLWLTLRLGRLSPALFPPLRQREDGKTDEDKARDDALDRKLEALAADARVRAAPGRLEDTGRALVEETKRSLSDD